MPGGGREKVWLGRRTPAQPGFWPCAARKDKAWTQGAAPSCPTSSAGSWGAGPTQALAKTHRGGSRGTAASIGTPRIRWLLRARGRRGGTRPHGAAPAPISPSEQLLPAVPGAKSDLQPPPATFPCLPRCFTAALAIPAGPEPPPPQHQAGHARSAKHRPGSPHRRAGAAGAPGTFPGRQARRHGVAGSFTFRPQLTPPANAGEGRRLRESKELSQKYF